MIFIVAEIGVNWDGDFNLAKDMIEKAKEAGCDAVKFQAFNEKLIENHPEHARLIKSAITKHNIETINELAQSVNIEWFCTPMYPEAVDFLDPVVKRYKIRESDGRPLLNNQSSNLLDRVLSTNKEIIVSCQKSPKDCTQYNNPKLKWLYCVPKYPCELSDLDFRNIKEYDGFSNHSPKIIAPITAAILGTQIIEVHITSDNSRDFADNNVSFNYLELNDLIKSIRLSEKITK